MSASLQRALQDDWYWWARPSQWPPDGDWRTWVCLGGRGAGKTRAGAEWVSALARSGRAGRIALIAPTFHDVREVMIDGVSGVRALGGERPAFEGTRRRLVWRNGAQATCFSAEDPESLRGPQFDAAWCDELCFWSYPDRTLATLAHAMRVGAKPRTMVTTTPRPIPALKRCLRRATPSRRDRALGRMNATCRRILSRACAKVLRATRIRGKNCWAN